ncbi:MAG TPA: glycoside-pentoside-hexuronide (GPH):cation symporter [Bacillota bacterium]|nr:glycoside-pentoside-hexuronide (GPH):cation symporter [Bacillota bacterium]
MEKNATVVRQNEKLPFKVKLAYGLSGYYSFITWTAFSYYGLYFFTDVVGLTAAFAGAIISLGTLWDAITDPLVGSISDNLKCKYGRRRPLIIGAAVPFVIISILLFTNWGFGESAAKVYFVIMILLYYTAQTVLDISSSALGSEMTLDYDERSTLATYKNYFGLLATVAISPTLVLVAHFGGWFENPDYGWSCTLAVYTIVALIFIIILWRTTRGYERHRGESGFKLSFDDIKVLFKNRATRIVALIFGIGIFSNTINYSIQVYYYTNYVEMTEAQIAAVTMVFGVTSIIGAWITDILMKKFGKKMAWIIGVGSEGIFLAVMVGLLINPGQIGLIYALVVLMAVGNAAIYQVPWAMIPDCVDVTELSTGKRMDGVIFGTVAFIQKASGALGAALLGVLLTTVGYSDTAVLAPETLSGIKNIFGFLVGGLYIVTILIVLKYPLGKEKHDRVREAIIERRQGKTIDMSEFKDLI